MKYTKPTKAEQREFESAHAEGLHDIPREGCPACEARPKARLVPSPLTEEEQAEEQQARQEQRDREALLDNYEEGT